MARDTEDRHTGDQKAQLNNEAEVKYETKQQYNKSYNFCSP